MLLVDGSNLGVTPGLAGSPLLILCVPNAAQYLPNDCFLCLLACLLAVLRALCESSCFGL